MCESDSLVVVFLKSIGCQILNTPQNSQTKFCMLLSVYAWFMTVELWVCSDLEVGVCIFKENVPIEAFNISVESTQNRQQHGAKDICSEVSKKKSYDNYKNGYNF